MEIEIKGHSGCQIEIVNEGNSLFIHKSTHDSKYVPRLHSQALKQQQASATAYQHIRVPEIYDIERSDDFLCVKMEYVYSKNFLDYFEDAGCEQIEYFIKALKIYIDEEIKSSPMVCIDRKIVLDKFEDVCNKVNENSRLREDADVMEIMEQSKSVFHNMDKSIEIPVGKCHGDLTFSNILFNGNNYYLIDFLDSFIESPLLDLVKIRQDSKYKWSRLMVGHELDGVRLKITSHKIDESIDRYYSQYEWYRKYYMPFQVMNFLRILQYAKEEKVIAYLKETLKSLLNRNK